MRAAAILALAATAAAHFRMDYPQSYFSDDDEPTAPCGGYNLNNTVDFHAGGGQIALYATHPQLTYLIRVASNNDVTQNVTNLYSADVQQTGLGTICLQNVMVPSSFVGTKGVLQVIGDSPDGILYQCASVNFVSGAATGSNSACFNSSGTSIAMVSDSKLAAAAGNSTNATSTSSGSSSMTSSTSSSSAAASTKASGAGRMVDSAQALLTAAIVGGVAFFASSL